MSMYLLSYNGGPSTLQEQMEKIHLDNVTKTSCVYMHYVTFSSLV